MKLYLGVDPAIIKTGWAILTEDKELVDYGIFKSGLSRRGASISRTAAFIAEIYISRQCARAYVERPVHQGIVGRTTGIYGWLLASTYCIIGHCEGRGVTCEPVDVSAWKGSAPKRIIWNRLEEIYGDALPRTSGKNYWEHDAVDAIGICRWGIDNSK